jgi:signal transduction histidine kinase/CheY-like chemotaxis protein
MNLPGFVRRSVRGKLLAVVLATTLVALLVNAAALLYYNVEDYRRTQLADVRTQAEILGRASAAALAFGDRREAERDLGMLQARGDVEAAALYGSDGRLFASYLRDPQAALPASAEAPGYRMSADRLRLFHPIVEKGDTIGTVYVRTRYDLRDRVLAYLGIVALVLAGALGVALLLSAWLQRALTRPILEVAAAARAVVERRDYSARASKTTDDEVGVLADAFNSMLKEVETRSQALLASNASLQREMLERVEAEEALRVADRRKDEFLATLAHELRNPLAPIRNALYLMQTTPDDREATASARAMVERQLHQMVRLVDDLLDVSRISTGKLALRRERVELRSVAQNAIEAVEQLFHSRGHVLKVEMPAPGVYVNADPTRLAQVFLNLLNNAAKFTDPGGRIDFRVELDGTELVASVRDNGIGIAAEMREMIFEMFAQADRSLERSATGLGVGLSLSRRLVELHGGSIEVRSAGIGRGAEFIVRIPAANAGVSRPLRPAPGRDPRDSRHRILLADDNRDFAVSLAALLRGMGNEVRVEHDGASALAAAEEYRPEFAFLDIGLPKLNGFDLARKLREANAACILVAVTGWGQASDRKLAKDAGFDDYIVKPVEIDRVQAILRGK